MRKCFVGFLPGYAILPNEKGSEDVHRSERARPKVREGMNQLWAL